MLVLDYDNKLNQLAQYAGPTWTLKRRRETISTMASLAFCRRSCSSDTARLLVPR
jgi:hypothetical protein